MDAHTALIRLLRAGWEVFLESEQLQVRHATQQLTASQRQYLTRYTVALLEALDDVLAFEERAAIAEYCGGLARDDAEQVARQWRERNSDAPSLGTAGVGDNGAGDDSPKLKSAGL